jgi:hypothetical protein
LSDYHPVALAAKIHGDVPSSAITQNAREAVDRCEYTVRKTHQGRAKYLTQRKSIDAYPDEEGLGVDHRVIGW